MQFFPTDIINIFALFSPEFRDFETASLSGAHRGAKNTHKGIYLYDSSNSACFGSASSMTFLWFIMWYIIFHSTENPQLFPLD